MTWVFAPSSKGEPFAVYPAVYTLKTEAGNDLAYVEDWTMHYPAGDQVRGLAVGRFREFRTVEAAKAWCEARVKRLRK